VNVARSARELAPRRRAVAIGTFDGVHTGHRRVLDAVLAASASAAPAVVTFDPHPRTVLGPPTPLLAAVERRLELLEAAGIEDVLLVPFDDALAALEPEAFVDTVLRPFGATVVVAGENFRFGRGRGGDLALLARLGFDARPVPLAPGVSSERIRELVRAHELAGAADLLGRPFEVEGIVVEGERLGRKLGFPTANLDVPPERLLPPYGIYAGAALGHRAAISIGVSPHYGHGMQKVEAHLLDFDGDLYGQRLVVELWAHLRGELAFASEAQLVEAIAADVEATRAALRPSGG
jgi:riboflavin kinase/FMN adenylyltransferase